VVCVLNGSGGGVVSCNRGNGVVIFFCNSGNGAHWNFSSSSVVHKVFFNAYGLGANAVLLGASIKVEFYIIKGK